MGGKVYYVGGATIHSHRKNFKILFKDYFKLAKGDHKERTIAVYVEEPEDSETKEILTDLMGDYVAEYGKQIKFHWI